MDTLTVTDALDLWLRGQGFARDSDGVWFNPDCPRIDGLHLSPAKMLVRVWLGGAMPDEFRPDVYWDAYEMSATVRFDLLRPGSIERLEDLIKRCRE